MRIFLVFILMALMLTSCGDYAALEQSKKNKKYADSLITVHKDSLKKLLNGYCDSIYEEAYDNALDSIREKELEKIIELSQ